MIPVLSWKHIRISNAHYTGGGQDTKLWLVIKPIKVFLVIDSLHGYKILTISDKFQLKFMKMLLKVDYWLNKL